MILLRITLLFSLLACCISTEVTLHANWKKASRDKNFRVTKVNADHILDDFNLFYSGNKAALSSAKSTLEACIGRRCAKAVNRLFTGIKMYSDNNITKGESLVSIDKKKQENSINLDDDYDEKIFETNTGKLVCPTVVANRGFINFVNMGNLSCKLNFGKKTVLTNMDGSVDNRWYGKFKWICSNDCQSTDYSKFTACDDCLYCHHNENIVECQSKSVPIMFGVGIGLVTSIVVVILLRWITLILQFYNVKERLEYSWKKLKAKKQHGDAVKQRELLNALLSKPIDTDRMKRTEILEDLKKELTVFNPEWTTDEYILRRSNIQSRIEFLEALDLIEVNPKFEIAEITIKPVPKNHTKRPCTCITILMILFCCRLPKLDACDNTMYIKSQNFVCRDESCLTGHTSLVTINENSKLCFLGDDFWMNIEMRDFKETVYYKPQYYTSAFTVHHKANYDCESSGECWGAGKSLTEDRIPAEEWDKFYSTMNNSSDKLFSKPEVHFEANSMNCGACFYDDQCDYAITTIKPKGPFYLISKSYKSVWSAKLAISGPNITMLETISSSKPEIKSKINLIAISNVNSKYVYPTHIITRENGLLETACSVDRL